MSERVFVFGEGATEKTVLDKLGEYLGADGLEMAFVGGKNNFRRKMMQDLEPEFSPGMPGRYVRVMVFRDVDRGETQDALQQSFASIARRLIDIPAHWRAVADAANVFAWDVAPTDARPGLRLVLHLAETPPVAGVSSMLPGFSDKTTDGYLLGLALSPGVVERFARDVGADAAVIVEKVTSELPRLFQQNRIPFESDKDYLAAYLVSTRFWKVKRTEAKKHLVDIILGRAAHAVREDFRAIMNSWLLAIEEARR